MASIFDIFREEGILKEAGEDDNQDQNAPAEEAPANDDAGTDDVGGDDFDIDASLDGEDTGDDEASPDGGEEDTTTDDAGSDSAESGDDEVNDDNTDIFAALTAEEQQIKIKELKNLFQGLYSSCDEISERINNLEIDEENIHITTRLSYAMYDLKRYISEYLISVFPKKSYVENDIAFNRFLSVVQSITTILDKYRKKLEKDDNL